MEGSVVDFFVVYIYGWLYTLYQRGSASGENERK